MQLTVTIDEDLLAKAQNYTSILDNSELIQEALIALLQRESAKSLAKVGGSQPDLKYIPRRRDFTEC